MREFIVGRLIQAVATVFVVSVVVFVFMHWAGDPAVLLLPPEAGTAELARFRHELGLDRPLYLQYVTFMPRSWYSDAVKSFRYSDRLLPLVLGHLRWTLVLAVASMGVAVLVALPLGAAAARWHGRPADVLIRRVAILRRVGAVLLHGDRPHGPVRGEAAAAPGGGPRIRRSQVRILMGAPLNAASRPAVVVDAPLSGVRV